MRTPCARECILYENSMWDVSKVLVFVIEKGPNGTQSVHTQIQGDNPPQSDQTGEGFSSHLGRVG